MALIQEEVAEQLKSELARLVNPVRLAVFSQTLQVPESEQVRRLVEELAGLDGKLQAESYNLVLDKEKASELSVTRIPAVAVLGAEKDYGIRFYGLPSGYEFGTLVDAILTVSGGDSGLSEATREALAGLDRPVHVQVFSTPTCPYCPQATLLAYRFALESDKVTADGVEVTGFADMIQRYRVSGVPKTVVGENLEFVGAQPEPVLLEHVLQAAAGGRIIV